MALSGPALKPVANTQYGPVGIFTRLERIDSNIKLVEIAINDFLEGIEKKDRFPYWEIPND